MKKILHISKRSIIRIGILMVIIGAAYIFDVCHQQSSNRKEKKTEQSNQLNELCAYSTFNSFKLKSTPDKFSGLKLFLRNQSRFLQQMHNLRANQLAKTEKVSHYLLSKPLVDFIQLRKYLYYNPDRVEIPLA